MTKNKQWETFFQQFSVNCSQCIFTAVVTNYELLKPSFSERIFRLRQTMNLQSKLNSFLHRSKESKRYSCTSFSSRKKSLAVVKQAKNLILRSFSNRLHCKFISNCSHLWELHVTANMPVAMCKCYKTENVCIFAKHNCALGVPVQNRRWIVLEMS